MIANLQINVFLIALIFIISMVLMTVANAQGQQYFNPYHSHFYDPYAQYYFGL